jgi:hypothetical protein
MLRATARVLVSLPFLLGPPARADHFAIDLEAQSPRVTKTAHGEAFALGVKPKPRAVLEAKAGDRLAVKWTLTSTAAKGTVKDVVVHFFVVKEEQAGQQALPKLDKDVWVETALSMDFNPKDKNRGELAFTIDKPGAYLLRLETIGAAVGIEGHEHFAALDLVIR